MTSETQTSFFHIVPPEKAVESMRDNGYKNAAYALAELIDNSIQAGAATVHVYVGQRTTQAASGRRTFIDQIAVLDDGTGMNAELLRTALQFGGGSHTNDRSGMGRFGMGLPSASISQCKHVDVYSWDNSSNQKLHCYLDIDEIANSEMTQVPNPEFRTLPKMWNDLCKINDSSTGTLVTWSKIDRVTWKTAEALERNTGEIVGRMYRKFLQTNAIKILITLFDVDNNKILKTTSIQPNDPTYLITPTSTPEPYSSNPMFEPFGEPIEEEFSDQYGTKHVVTITCSMAKDEVRNDPDTIGQPGSTPYGQHAGRNQGVSVIRGGRELELSLAWNNPSDPRERWWGIDIEFDPISDELLGVTNNKQSARYLNDVTSSRTLEELSREAKISPIAYLNQLKDNGDEGYLTLKISESVKRQILSMNTRLRAQTARIRRRRDAENGAERKATNDIEARKKRNQIGDSDADEKLSDEEKKQLIKEGLIQSGVDPNEAEDTAKRTVDEKFKVLFTPMATDSGAFFAVRSMGGSLTISLNTNHPVYENFVDIIDGEHDGASLEDLKQRLDIASESLKLLLASWARYEDEQPVGEPKNNAMDARVDWGRVARDFLNKEQ